MERNRREEDRRDTGPAGSGKTWFMINSKESNEIGLYLSASDLQFPENFFESSRDTFTDTLKIFTDAVRNLVPPRVHFLLKQCKPEDCGLYVVVDEMGTSPQLLRALCKCAVGLEKNLQKALGVCIPCDFMVGGSGLDRIDLSCGSMPSTLRLLSLPTNSLQVWETLANPHRNGDDLRAKNFLQVLETDASALRLATNPRAVVLMLEELKTQSSPMWAELGKNPSPQAIKSAIPLFLVEVAKRFRQRSRMFDLESSEQIEQIYQEALVLVLFPQPPKKQNEQEEAAAAEEAIKRKLIGTYGVVMDEAIYSRGGGFQPGKYIGYTSDHFSIHTPQQRYTIAPAQVELLRLGCGLRAGGFGEGMVGAASELVEMMLLVGRGRPLQQVLDKLGRFVIQEDGKGKEVELAHQGVSVIQSSMAANPSSDSDWNAQIQARISDNKAVVLVNSSSSPSSSSPFAPLADLVVLVPGVAVVLAGSSPKLVPVPSAEQVWRVLHKMGHPGNNKLPTDQSQHAGEEEEGKKPEELLRVLCELSRVALSSVFWVVAVGPSTAEQWQRWREEEQNKKLLSQLSSQGAERVLWLQASESSLLHPVVPFFPPAASEANPKKRSHDNDD